MKRSIKSLFSWIIFCCSSHCFICCSRRSARSWRYWL
ncbi:hypothetical protein EVA_11419 [gut metagenome]|uniref:Uncharacterized protein n=1 Tax=gut metagenome TaxID=749906 RepID=J9GL68_9ZZZZ